CSSVLGSSAGGSVSCSQVERYSHVSHGSGALFRTGSVALTNIHSSVVGSRSAHEDASIGGQRPRGEINQYGPVATTWKRRAALARSASSACRLSMTNTSSAPSSGP